MKPLKILHIEDEPSDASLLKLKLKRAQVSADIQVVTDTQSLKDAIQEFKPEVVVSDNSMPNLTAKDALALIKASLPEVPFVLFTGAVRPTPAEEATIQAADHFFLKDDINQLVGWIKSYQS
ncbi:MAG: response regulator [Bacteroidota bacterium]